MWLKILVNISCRLTIKKNDIELEITSKDKQTKESIFNKYIDEIIYFFEVTKYDIVIFEDLDRLKNYSGLFVKLREMNTLLNNSKIIKKNKITFVYAVSDIISSSKIERTVKIDILCECKDEIQFKNISQKQNIIDFILRGRKCININYNIFKQLFDNTLDSIKLIDLLMFQDAILNNEQISECLLKLKEPYSNIPKQEKIPKLEINSQNIKFKEFLENCQFDYLGKITKTKDNRYYKINKKVKLL